MKITWYGTATIGIDDGKTKLLFPCLSLISVDVTKRGYFYVFKSYERRYVVARNNAATNYTHLEFCAHYP